MRFKWLYLIVIICIMMIVGCEQKATSKSTVSGHGHKEIKTESKENMRMNDAGERESTAQLDVEDVHDIISSTIISLDKMIDDLSSINDKWYDIAIENTESEPYTDEFHDAVSELQDELSPMMTADALSKFGDELLLKYFCACDTYLHWQLDDIKTRLTIEKQDKDTFIATSISVGSNMMNTGFTNEWHFKKENGTWKLNDFVYLFTDEQPLQLTFEDLEDYFRDNETDESTIAFIDETQIDGTSFIVIEHDNEHIAAFNTETGELDSEVMLEYTESK